MLLCVVKEGKKAGRQAGRLCLVCGAGNEMHAVVVVVMHKLSTAADACERLNPFRLFLSLRRFQSQL